MSGRADCQWRVPDSVGMESVENSVQLRNVVPEDLEVFLAYEHDPEAVRRSRFAPGRGTRS
ncbi:N-acetyltransferase GCN5 [Streptomyces badius]